MPDRACKPAVRHSGPADGCYDGYRGDLELRARQSLGGGGGGCVCVLGPVAAGKGVVGGGGGGGGFLEGEGGGGGIWKAGFVEH